MKQLELLRSTGQFGEQTKRCPNIIHKLALILVIIELILLAQVEKKFKFTDASLIHIYHKYKPSETLQDLVNEPGGNLSQLVASQATPDAAPESSHHEERRTAVEFTSPMKRIMELISSHSPVIFVSGDSDSQVSDNLNHRQPQSTSNTDQSANHQQRTTSADQQQQQQQHWTLLDPNQVVATTSSSSEQPILATQQQQLIQASIPYEQYFLTSPTAMTNDNNQQFAVLPANLAFTPTNSYQQVAAIPIGAYVNQNQQAGTNVIQQQVVEDRAQPIFLSSYVPEVPANQLAKNNALPFTLNPTQLVAPDSIQQIQQAQEAKRDKVEKNANDEENDNENDFKANDEPDDNSSNGNDLDEPSKVKRAGKKQASDDEAGGSSGSMVYEDKFDSDKDEQPSRRTSSRGSTEPITSNSMMTNGLINVGLNDDCLQCICRASSGCDHMLRCITLGAEEKFCGPFQLTEEYWNKAGSPGDSANNFISFEDCANDADCAVETVTNYMKKYHKDCDGDENITCMDYARLHRLKPSECDNTDKLVNHFDAYWAKFQRCAEGYNRSRNGDDEDI